MSADVLSLISTTLDHLSQALILALAVAAVWLAPPLSPSDAQRRGRLLLVLMVMILLCGCIDLLLRTAVMADVEPGEAWDFVPRVLAHSDYGFYWQWRTAAWIVLLLVSLWVVSRGWDNGSVWLLVIAALAIMLLVSVTHHAGEDGLWSVANLVNWLHLAGISIWGGAVVTCAMVVMPELRRYADAQQTAITAQRLSALATAALAVVLLSGIFNSWRQVDEFSQLWTTVYGRVLSIKLALVGIMMVIGALNRFLWVPEVIARRHAAEERWSTPSQRLFLALRVDSLIFIAVMITAVVLGSQSPPAHAI